MTNEALDSLQHVLQSIPTWIADLERIVSSARQRQIQLLAELSDADELQRPLKRRRRSRSECSASNGHKNTPVPDVVYDGEAQRSLDNLIRAIGVSRNKIRKGKLCARLEGLSGRSSGSDSSLCSSIAGQETIKGLGTFTYRTTTTQHRSGADESVTVFDKVDGLLEESQTQCEKAAHQLLREGNCTSTPPIVQGFLSAALAAAEHALPTMLKQAGSSNDSFEQAPSTHSESISIPSDGLLEVDTDATEEDTESESEFNVSTMKVHLVKAAYNREARTPFAVH